MEIAKVPASHGLRWLMQGFVLLRRNFFIWLAFVLLLWALVFVAARIPLVGLALALLTPVFLGGLMIGARAVEKGEELEIAHFFAGFRTNTISLVSLGAFYLLGNVVIAGLMYAIGGDAIQKIVAGQSQNMDPEVLMQALGPALLALLVAMALSIPLTMALWFAPLLVVFRNQKPATALRDSFKGCLRNMLPFLVYGLIVMVPLIALMTQFDLANMDRNPGLWIVALFVLPSVYTSYRDIYEGPPPAPPAAA
ncbi:MAG TPA: BPSS1780 family membrane protein [Burkholderiales bacterium]|nr:BPSS1780 family membrane protein [Burkholderiales bacterium]